MTPLAANPTIAETTALERELARMPGPVLVVSTAVGRGMYSIGEALLEMLGSESGGRHVAIEECLGGAQVREDLERYRWISNHFPGLLVLPYRFPPIYWRKLLRERWFRGADLSRLRAEIERGGFRSVVCVSHRPAFWVGALKRRERLPIALAGLLGEYGSSLGWKYNFWDEIDSYLSPVPRAEIGFGIPARVRFVDIELPARRAFRELASAPGDRRSVLVICGLWGQGPIARIAGEIVGAAPEARVHAVCGENDAARRALEAAASRIQRLTVHGALPSIAPLLAECGSVVTKPGISTLLEAHAARRQLFLLRGMPVAEDHNRDHAIRRFGARPYDPAALAAFIAGADPNETAAAAEAPPW